MCWFILWFLEIAERSGERSPRGWNQGDWKWCTDAQGTCSTHAVYFQTKHGLTVSIGEFKSVCLTCFGESFQVYCY